MDGQQILWMTSASPPAFWENDVTLGASLSLVRGINLISMTHYERLSLLLKLLNLILYSKIMILICLSTIYFSDNIT